MDAFVLDVSVIVTFWYRELFILNGHSLNLTVLSGILRSKEVDLI